MIAQINLMNTRARTCLRLSVLIVVAGMMMIESMLAQSIAAFGSGGSNGVPQATSLVAAVADTNHNNLVVNAPEKILKELDALVGAFDVEGAETNTIQVFGLKNSDPTEMVRLITSLFPDPNQGCAPGLRGGGGVRPQRLGRVVAVAELRTSSVIVSASIQMMGYISDVVEQIDASPRDVLEVNLSGSARPDWRTSPDAPLPGRLIR